MDKKKIVLIGLFCCTVRLLFGQEEASVTMLQPTVVRPGINPAHRIIQNAVSNRDQNHPEKTYSYRCVQYNKSTLNVSKDSTSRRFVSIEKQPLLGLDSLAHNLIMESVVSRTFVAPQSLEEKVIASKTSGFKEYQQLSVVPSLFQFFHFYDDRIEWKNMNLSYLNPISPNSTDKYFFLLQDTLFSPNGDTTFVVSFQPSRLSNIDGLKGTLYINTNGWAIEKVVAEPATTALFPIKIEQQYRLIDSSVWFPHLLSLEVSYKNFAFSGLNMECLSTSQLSDIEISPDVGGQKIAAKTLTIDREAYRRIDIIERYRTIPLSQRELNTYQRYSNANFDWLMQIAEGAVDNNSFSFKKVEIPFNQVVNYNYYEGWHFGMGLYSNWHLSPHFSAGGFFRYGLKDKKEKYGVSLSFFPEKDWDTECKVWAYRELSGLSYSDEAGVFASRWIGNFFIRVQGKAQELAPIFDYSYKGVLFDHSNRLRNSELELQVRYTKHEMRAKIFRRTYPFRSDHPVFTIKYAMGLRDFFHSHYSYQKAEAGMQFNRFFRNFGRTYFTVWGGIVSKEIPVMMLFNQSYIYRTVFYNEDSKSKFNAIVNQVYAAHQYINGFLFHDFGSLFYKTKSKIFHPRFGVAQSAGWSRLYDLQDHEKTSLCDMQKGYFESGIVIEDILRVNYANLFYFGFGGALYGAYGCSVEAPFEKTLTPMVRLSISF